MGIFDVTGKRVNAGDRFTRNAVIIIFALGFWVRMFIYIFKGKDDPQQEALTQCLIASISLIFGYFLGRNTQPANESKAE